MKIKTDFVTNSSSTSFIVISDRAITRNDFLDLLGISNESPLIEIFSELYDRIIENSKVTKGVALQKIINDSPDAIAEKIKNAIESRKIIQTGELSSEDGNYIESYFCVESFEAENEHIYFNCLECVW